MKFPKYLFSISDYSDDRYDEKPSHQKNVFERLWETILRKIGIRRYAYDEEYVSFEYAGVHWSGYADGRVSPHPSCIVCDTQLSFTSKDTVMCDHCHKYKKNLGEFTFQIDSKNISFEIAYNGAQDAWEKLKHDFFEE
ncbi:hypothetical protein KDK77_08795 [bacterium]|nr:hypothetical protein [bacterium]MCP5462373.1 hypothetical protein [bacterium]